MAALFPGKRLGSYEILDVIGTGGMGEVYRARDAKLNRDVALKVLPPAVADDPDRRARFEREAQAAAALNHPNIVTIHSVEEADGVRFLTMELVEGTPLSDLIPPSGLPLERLLKLAVPLVDAVHAAHHRGIVHRDLKPANVMVTADHRVKVLDFGLAKLREPVPHSAATMAGTAAGTEAGRIIGTVSYMSPEQAEGREVDGRSDIFALGVLLYEMTAGRRPFEGSSSVATISAILRDTPPSLTDVRGSIPPDFARIVRRCLAKDPDRRYQTALDLRTELEELKEDSRLPSAASRTPATPRRASGWPWIAAAAVVAAGVIGFGVWSRSSSTSPTAAPMPVTERQLTSNPLQNPIFATAISPDGRYVAYADGSAIHIRLIDTGETRTLPLPDGFCFICASLSWSGDGTRILAAGPAGPSQRDGLWSISTLTGEIRQMMDDVRAVTRSPDGSLIALFRGTADIWVMHDTGADARLLFSGGSDFTPGAATFSPDGRWLAYLRRNRGASSSSIEARHVTSGQVRELVAAAANEEPVWTRRGLMYMTHLSPDSHDLWELPVNDATADPQGPAVRLTRWTGFVPGSISPVVDGSRFAMVRLIQQSDVHVATVGLRGLSDEKQLTVDTRNDSPATWHGPGAIYFVTNRMGSDDIWKHPLQGDGEGVVVGPSSTRSPRVSPDGRWLLYLDRPVAPPAGTPPPFTLMRAPLGGGAGEAVFQIDGLNSGGSPFGWSSMFPDIRCPTAPASRCVVAEERDRTVVFTTFDPIDGRKQEVAQVTAPAGEIAWDVSADGGRLAYTRWAWDDGHKISVVSVANGQTSDVPITGWTSLSAVAWTPDGAGLFVVSARRNGGTLLRVGLDGQMSVLRTETGRWLLMPRPSPDGRTLAFAVATADAKVWLAER